MAISKCIKCGRDVSVPDISRKYICLECKAKENSENKTINKLEENILNRNVNDDFVEKFHEEHYYDSKTNKFKKRYRMKLSKALIINALLLIALYLVICLSQYSIIGLKELLRVSFYYDVGQSFLDALKLIIGLDETIPQYVVILLFPGVYIFYLSVVITMYNIIDLISTPYWLKKKNSKKRNEKRGKFIKGTFLLPIKIPFIFLKYYAEVILIVLGAHPKYSKLDKPTSYRSSNNQYKVDTAFSTGNSADLFTEEYINAAAYAYNHGGPIIIKDTHGLSSDEIQMAMANGEAYLDTLGIHRSKR